jgi:23S rRNA pseudouridine2605 synthase
LAHRLTHPRYEVPKTYVALLGKPIAAGELERLARGVELEDGPTAPTQVKRRGDREVEIVLREGRNRQVRRMLEAVGNEVLGLRRVAFGPFELGDLKEGSSRRLSEDEVAWLREAAG